MLLNDSNRTTSLEKTQIQLKFSLQLQGAVNGNDFVSNHFGANAGKQRKCFKRLLTLTDPRTSPPSKATHSNCKADSFFSRVNRVSLEACDVGENTSCDE